jgi:hypothetical protein
MNGRPEQQNRSLATAHFGSALRKRFWSARLGNDLAVTDREWHRYGYLDGRHGNPKWPPPDRRSRKQYLAGYRLGKADSHADA